MTIRTLLAASLAALALSACATMDDGMDDESYTAATYAAALADPSRPAAERERDAARLPGELLAFAQITRGEKVGDYIMGGGYLTRILAAAVGPEGRVYAFQPAEFIAFRSQYGDDQRTVDAAYDNVDAVAGSVVAPAWPEPLDTIITVQNFHDLYNKRAPTDTGLRAARALFGALKPGGTMVVVDHSAAAGTGSTLSDALHRIDKATVIEAFAAAGFKLEAQSDLYARPADPRTANVFDASIRGQTDQFTLRFRKPG
ncbi:MAG TPA: methyltransferase [Novosphingobium sp.]|nr:methyltransferase [Novosphingobium sp.]